MRCCVDQSTEDCPDLKLDRERFLYIVAHDSYIRNCLDKVSLDMRSCAHSSAWWDVMTDRRRVLMADASWKDVVRKLTNNIPAKVQRMSRVFPVVTSGLFT